MRLHVDYGDITYGQPNNEHSIQKKKIKELNTILPLQLQVSSKEHLKVSWTVN